MASAILHSLGITLAGIVHCIPLETMWLPSAAPFEGVQGPWVLSPFIHAMAFLFKSFVRVVVVDTAMGIGHLINLF
jgi:hypothetical protein